MTVGDILDLPCCGDDTEIKVLLLSDGWGSMMLRGKRHEDIILEREDEEIDAFSWGRKTNAFTILLKEEEEDEEETRK